MHMKYRFVGLALLVACGGSVGFGTGAEIQNLTASNLPEFLVRFRRDLKQANLDLSHLSDAKLPLLDEAGHPLGRRRITDRRQTLIDLRKTLDDLERDPKNLVVAMTLSDQTEELADEIYDLAQIAYDNDREELAMEFTDLLKALNDDTELVQAYALKLAAEKEHELRRLQRKQQPSALLHQH
jgi:hypothetical protein